VVLVAFPTAPRLTDPWPRSRETAIINEGISPALASPWTRRANQPDPGNISSEARPRTVAIGKTMRDPSTAGAAAEERATGGSARESLAAAPPGPDWTSREAVRAAAGSVARLAPALGWGLLALGLLAGLERILGLTPLSVGRPAELPHTVVDAAFRIVAFGLAGLATTLFCRLAAALIVERIERAGRGAGEMMAQAVHGIQALGQIARALESLAEQPAASPPSPSDRERSLAEIDRAIRSARWAEATALLEDFEARFPEDPGLPGLTAQLEANRRRSAQNGMAQLEAARQVNDPARVLELYQAVGPALEIDQRAALERDLARWFLSLIHRRLRTGKIQPEVVILATQVAETFGTTVEGASMRAALPTLRRSVGLCPRCAQPYTGVAEACPQCLSGRPKGPLRATPDQASMSPETGHHDDFSDDPSSSGRSD